MSSLGWYGVDLDGTVAEYTGWQGPTHIGKPIPRMVERIKKWRALGQPVKIFTARVSCPTLDEIGDSAEFLRRKREADQARAAIEIWCQKHLGEVLPVTNVKDYAMIELWDDRAVQIVANTGLTIEEYLKTVV